ncbi:DMT family transporter [Cognatitamlana onchidii]|uniref:DMT family transporter n=1 Tax=Cognatitamlana onchidii TaxID=2562860 RepID=UPI0010A5D665|nr:EamA family transporter [Algibacter onchidii]
MPSAKVKNHIHLHILVFIAGFTAVLGELISIAAVHLVWYRMVIASILMLLYIKIVGVKINIDFKSVVRFSIAGIIIALHWITFFGAIEVSNISITLAMFSTGAFFASFIEPIIYKRTIIWYEILFGVVVIIAVFIITQSEIRYLMGVLLGVSSAFFSSLFSVLNGSFLKKHSAIVISFYEFLSGVFFITIYIVLFEKDVSLDFFKISMVDFKYLLILGSVCTAYAFIASVHIMKVISPYTVVLTYNLEPIYGIIMAMVLFPEKEKMGITFYYGALIIIVVVIINAILKRGRTLKRQSS